MKKTHVAHLEYMPFLFIIHTLIKLEKLKIKKSFFCLSKASQ